MSSKHNFQDIFKKPYKGHGGWKSTEIEFFIRSSLRLTNVHVWLSLATAPHAAKSSNKRTSLARTTSNWRRDRTESSDDGGNSPHCSLFPHSKRIRGHQVNLERQHWAEVSGGDHDAWRIPPFTVNRDVRQQLEKTPEQGGWVDSATINSLLLLSDQPNKVNHKQTNSWVVQLVSFLNYVASRLLVSSLLRFPNDHWITIVYLYKLQ